MKPKCDKKAFKDHAHAVHALHKIKNHENKGKKPHRAYECEKCGKWHLTSTEIDKHIPRSQKKLAYTNDWKRLIT